MTYNNFWWQPPTCDKFYVRVAEKKAYSLENGEVFVNGYSLANKDLHPWGVIIGELFTND